MPWCRLSHLQQQQRQALVRIAELEAEVVELRARLNQHSQNSSKPPSSDPPSAPPWPARAPRGRQAGGQKGHPRHERPTPDPDHIDAVRVHFPSQCPSCQTDLAERRQDACAPQIQFAWELPEIRPSSPPISITPSAVRAVAPGDRRAPAGCGAGAFGVRATAGVALLHGDHHLSHRAVTRLFADFFGFPISL